MGKRSDAKSAGKVKYPTGKPCKRGHTGERWVASGACVQCVRDDQRKPSYVEKAKALAARPDQKAWLKAWDQAYRKTPKQLAYHAYNEGFRKAQKLRATPSWLTATQIESIRAFYTEAKYLTVQTGVLHHVDHIIPLRSEVVCGLHVPWNLRVIPASENLRKGNSIELIL